MRMCHFRAQNSPFVLNKFFLVQTIIITFIYLLALFIVQNLKKFLQRIQSYEDVPFLGPKWSICPKQFFFWKIINIILIYLLAPFIVQNFKKILPADPELWGCAIFGPKMAHFPKWEFFFRKPVNEPCFFHSCLPTTCQKSNWDTNLLVKYWQLKNREISLARSHFLVITWETDFSQACSFRRMLLSHKNFHFTQIPDKTNDVMFLKSSKAMFLDHFWPFLVIFARRFSPKNPALSHTSIYGPLTPC